MKTTHKKNTMKRENTVKTPVDFSKFDFEGKTDEEIRKIKAAEYRRRYYNSHKKEFTKRNMKWAKEHPEKMAEYRHKYYEEHKEEHNEKMAEFKRKNPEYYKKYWKKYYRKMKKAKKAKEQQ